MQHLGQLALDCKGRERAATRVCGMGGCCGRRTCHANTRLQHLHRIVELRLLLLAQARLATPLGASQGTEQDGLCILRTPCGWRTMRVCDGWRAG